MTRCESRRCRGKPDLEKYPCIRLGLGGVLAEVSLCSNDVEALANVDYIEVITSQNYPKSKILGNISIHYSDFVFMFIGTQQLRCVWVSASWKSERSCGAEQWLHFVPLLIDVSEDWLNPIGLEKCLGRSESTNPWKTNQTSTNKSIETYQNTLENRPEHPSKIHQQNPWGTAFLLLFYLVKAWRTKRVALVAPCAWASVWIVISISWFMDSKKTHLLPIRSSINMCMYIYLYI